MKAVVYSRYGSPEVLELRDVEKPVPDDDEILIRTCAATVTAGDCEVRSFTFPMWIWLPLRIMFGLIKPRFSILGQELAGEVEAVGKDVTNFKKGDRVYAVAHTFGAYAEYKCIESDGPIAMMPANMSYEEAASIPTGAYNALHFLRRANIREGQKVIIIGACGGIGVLAIQLARYFGAEVTGVDSADKLETLRAIGADHVIDYAKVDFTRTGETYDVIMDVFGGSPYSRCINSLRPNGYYLLANPRFIPMLRALWTSKTSDKTVVVAFAAARAEDLDFIRSLIEAGTIKAVIDRSYSLEQMAEAHAYVETGRKKGSVAISIDHRD